MHVNLCATEVLHVRGTDIHALCISGKRECMVGGRNIYVYRRWREKWGWQERRAEKKRKKETKVFAARHTGWEVPSVLVTPAQNSWWILLAPYIHDAFMYIIYCTKHMNEKYWFILKYTYTEMYIHYSLYFWNYDLIYKLIVLIL